MKKRLLYFLSKIFSVNNVGKKHKQVTILGMRIKIRRCFYKNYTCVSVGHCCHTAMHLDRLGIRKYSYPSDWIVPIDGVCNIEFLFECLLNGFKNFLNIEDLAVEKIEEGLQHHFLRNNYTGFWHIHDFDINKNVEADYIRNLRKYKRRAKRLFKHLRATKNIYLFYCRDTWSNGKSEVPLISNDTWNILIYRFMKKYRNKNVQLLIFRHDDNFEKYEYKENQVTPNITEYFSNHKYTENDEELGTILSIAKIINDRFVIDKKKGITKDKKIEKN